MTQKDAVMEMLTEAGPAGVTNAEFAQRRILRFGARVQELREAGAEIACERVSGGTYVYKLSKRPGGVETGQPPSGPASSSATGAPLCTVRELNGEWHEIPTPAWALAGGGG